MQADLLEELLATGTPVVVVVVSGRPYALGAVHGRAAGLVQAFMPGEEGGPAIAGVLSGRVQPSGKLPVQIPRRPGGQPGTYLQPPLGAENTDISPVDPTPLFAFGHGASYTRFEVGDLRIGDAEVPTDGELTVTVTVRNVGDREGRGGRTALPRDPVAQVVRPVRQLAGFARVALAPGARRGRSGSGCTPTGPPSPGARWSGSSSPGRSRSPSARPRPTCRAAARSGSPGRHAWSTTSGGWSRRWSSAPSAGRR